MIWLLAQEITLGPDHPSLASALSNLGAVLQNSNRLAEAEPLHHPARTIREKALAPNHAQALESLQFLARLLEATGRVEEAVPLRQQALKYEFGPEHPDTLRSWNNRSHALRKQGHADQAEPIDRQLVAATAKVLGKDHRLTIHRRNNLVLTLIMLGKLAEARGLLLENWHTKAELFANTTPRVTFLRHVVALLESQLDGPFLGQIKTLISGPELPLATDVALPWDVAYFIEHLRSQLPPGFADFLTALVAATNPRGFYSTPKPAGFPREWETLKDS